LSLFWPPPHPPELIGRPSRKGATAVIKAHVRVLEGGGLKGALADALAETSGLGGNDRRFVAVAARELSRHQRLLDLAAKLLDCAPGDWVLREDRALVRYLLWRRLFTAAPVDRILTEVKLPGPVRPRSVTDAELERVATRALPPDPGLPPSECAAARYSFPTWMAQALTEETMAALSREPALILRARPPGQREARRAELAKAGVAADPIGEVPDALLVKTAGTRVFDTPPMKRGLLQVQDAGSQLIVELCRPNQGFAGARIADLCAGAGGKALALADRVGRKGRVDATDASAPRLGEARRRARAWRLSQVHFPSQSEPEKADVVLIDAPCSGTGSLSREPDQKWKLSPDAIARFAKRQRDLLSTAAERARPGALIVYATCSLMRGENEEVVEAALAARADLALEPAGDLIPEAARNGPFLQAIPGRFPGGGFFAARFRKKSTHG
jgi:16S rRNA (cytosine967-C5)-methyltransferase